MPKKRPKPHKLILEGDPRLSTIDPGELAEWLDRALVNAPPLSRDERRALADSLARRRQRQRSAELGGAA